MLRPQSGNRYGVSPIYVCADLYRNRNTNNHTYISWLKAIETTYISWLKAIGTTQVTAYSKLFSSET